MTRPLPRAALLVAVAAALLAPQATPTLSAAAPRPARVVEGSDGYLFIAQDWTVACQDTGQARRVATAARDLAAALEAGGREAVVVVGPDKSTVVARAVPRVVPDRTCGAASRAALWRELARTAGPAFLDLRPALAATDRRVRTYWRKDTHWTPTGGAVYARALAERLDPALAARLTTQTTTHRRAGDLARVLGRPQAEAVHGFRLVNPGVQVEELAPVDIGMGQPARRTRATPVGPGARVLPGRTVLVGDSFDAVALEQLAPLFEETLSFWPGGRDSSLPTVFRQLQGADRVVVETVERFGQRFRMFDAAAVRAARALPPRTRARPGA